MACDREWHFDTEQFLCTGVQLFEPKTRWVPVADGAEVGAAVRVGTSGNGRVYLGVRYAAVRPDSPSAASTLGTFITGVTEVARSETLSATSYMWAQFGYVYDLSSGSTNVSAMIGMDLHLHQCVTVIGARRCEVSPSVPAYSAGSTDDAFVYELGPFVSSVGLSKLKAGIINRGLLNSGFETMLVYRTATNRASPSDWNFSLEASWNNPSAGNSERCTGELSPSSTTDILIQPGLAVRRKSGGSQDRGDFEVTVFAAR